MADIHPDAWVAPTAVVRGDVTIGSGSRVLDLAVLQGELGPITHRQRRGDHGARAGARAQ